MRGIIWDLHRGNPNKSEQKHNTVKITLLIDTNQMSVFSFSYPFFFRVIEGGARFKCDTTTSTMRLN